MLSLNKVNCGYENIQVLRDVSLNIEKQKIVSLIGANGAGKSTTLKAITGLLKPVLGKLYFENTDISKMRSHEIVKLGISHVPEGRRIFPLLTVKENLELGGYLLKSSAKRKQLIDRMYQMFPILFERKNQPGMTLSGGEQQMLAIGRGLMSVPKLLLLDEPFLGVAPIFIEKIVQFIQTINQEGMTILLVEQNVSIALSLSQYAYVMENGKIVLQGPGKDLIKNPDVKKKYLGEI